MIPAGGSGTITAKVTTNPVHSGRSTKSVTVTTDAPGEEYLRLSFSYQAVAAVIARPRLELVLTGVEGDTLREGIVLHRLDGEPLIIRVELEALGELLEVTAMTADDPAASDLAPGDVRLEARLSPNTPPGRHGGLVIVHTNHPLVPRLRVPVAIWVRSLIDVRPAAVRLQVDHLQGTVRPVMVRLTHSERNDFDITAIENPRPDLFTVHRVTNDPQRYQALRIELAEKAVLDALPAEVAATVRVMSSDPAKPVIEIPVTLTRRPPSRPRTGGFGTEDS